MRVGSTCGGTSETPDYVCINDDKRGVGSRKWIAVGDIPRMDNATRRSAQDALLNGAKTDGSGVNYYQLCKWWMNNNTPEKTWKNMDIEKKRCTNFCQNYMVRNPKAFRNRKNRTEIEGRPLWKIKGLE